MKVSRYAIGSTSDILQLNVYIYKMMMLTYHVCNIVFTSCIYVEINCLQCAALFPSGFKFLLVD